MDTCKNCASYIFDEKWGEYKCKVYQHRIYDIDRYIDCRDHTKKQEDIHIGNMAQCRTEV